MMPGPDRENIRKINDNEIESQTAEEPQDERETCRSMPVWQRVFVRARTLQLLALRMREVALPPVQYYGRPGRRRGGFD